MSLDFQLQPAAPASAATDCVVVGLFADKTLSPAAQALDAASGGRLAALAERGDLSGKTGRTLLLQDLPGVTSPRVVVVGLGERAKFGEPQYLKAVADAVRAPVIASGGVGNLDHMVDGIRDGHATAVLAASIFHFGTYSIAEAKAHMARAGLAMRLDSAPPPA